MEQVLAAACFTFVAVGTVGAGAAFVYRARHPRMPLQEPIPSVSIRFSGGAPMPGGQVETLAPRLPDIRKVLRNEDIIELSRSGLGPEILMKLISKSPHQFDVEPKALAALKRAGVKDQVIGLIIDVSVAVPAPAPSVTASATVPEDSTEPVRAAGWKQESKPVAASTKLATTPPVGTLVGRIGN
jgi:hypothetical protein